MAVYVRMEELNERYLERAFTSANPLILDLAENYRRSFHARIIRRETCLCDFKDEIDVIFRENEEDIDDDYLMNVAELF